MPKDNDKKPDPKPAKIKPGKTKEVRGRQFRRDGIGFNEVDKKQPEIKPFHDLKEGTTLAEFVADSDMCENPKSAEGQIKGGKYTVGTAKRQGEGWVLQRPIECVRIRDPKYVLRPPCVVRGGFDGLKVAIITGSKSE